MSLKIPVVSKVYFLALMAAVLAVGCSSTEISGPDASTSENDSGDNSAKITITTTNNGSCPETNIEFDIAVAGEVYFEITNATGYHVRTLIDREMEAGSYYVMWDHTNDAGEDIDSGIYLFHLVTSDFESWQASSIRFLTNE